jgi:hypothetical protein
MAGKVFGVLTLVVVGAMVANALAHPAGTVAASKGISNVLTPSFATLHTA